MLFPFGTRAALMTLWERPCVPTLWHMRVIRPRESPTDFTNGDDVTTRKYKCTCGEDSSSFCCSVSALCVLLVIHCFLSHYIIIKMATGKHLISSVAGCVFLPALASLRVGIHTVCALLFWERSTPLWGGRSRQCSPRFGSRFCRGKAAP